MSFPFAFRQVIGGEDNNNPAMSQQHQAEAGGGGSQPGSPFHLRLQQGHLQQKPPQPLPRVRSRLGEGAASASMGRSQEAKSTLKVFLPNGGFNMVKFGDATDVKVIIPSCSLSFSLSALKNVFAASPFFVAVALLVIVDEERARRRCNKARSSFFHEEERRVGC